MSRAMAVCLLVCALLLAACGPRHSVRVDPVPVRDGQPAPSRKYVVVRGDTLYGIAFRHGMDYRELARINRVAAPYTIYPGQRLTLAASATNAKVRRPRPPGRSSAGNAGVVAPIVSPPRAAAPAPARSPTTTPAAKPPAVSSTKPAGKPSPASPGGPVGWRWPADGALLSTYSAGDPTRQGINIGGEAGHPVRAAGAGVVVYSGSGLIGYGELVIIKHSDEWLSAYGHNRKRLVDEGERVTAGQPIAEMGRSGASRDMLHFEIRRNGKPVDPLGLLPKR